MIISDIVVSYYWGYYIVVGNYWFDNSKYYSLLLCIQAADTEEKSHWRRYNTIILQVVQQQCEQNKQFKRDIKRNDGEEYTILIKKNSRLYFKG